MTSDEERNFLARWSQRKREAARDSEAKALAPVPDTQVAETEEEDFDLSLLPKLEDMTPQTDLTLFFKKGVPEFLRNAALRKMWTLDPAIRDYRSEALDYAYDWNAPGGVPGGGDLPADYDSREMVARIFGDEPADKNVIEDVAVQQNQSLGEKGPNVAPPELVSEPENIVKTEQPQAFADNMPLNAADESPPKKSRHGKALPSGPTKL